MIQSVFALLAGIAFEWGCVVELIEDFQFYQNYKGVAVPPKHCSLRHLWLL